MTATMTAMTTMTILLPAVRCRRETWTHVNVSVLVVVEIEDGEDENIEHEDDFLEKLKGKVGMHDVLRARGMAFVATRCSGA